MATGNYTGTNTNGVTYALTYNPGVLGVGASYTLAITYPDGTTLPAITGINPNNVLTATGGTLTIASLVSNPVYVIPPGVTGSVNTTISLLSGATIYVGGTAAITSTANLLSGVTVDVDGGTALLGNNVDVGSGSIINLDNGGTFSASSTVASALTGTTINFGANGGTFIADGGGAAINLSGLTINGFDAARDTIQFIALPPGVAITGYTIATVGATQTITATDANNTPVVSLTVNGTAFTPATYAVGTGPLTLTESGTTLTVVATSPAPVCFLRETRIATPFGETPVQELRAGDLVVVLEDGRRVTRTVTWVGHASMDTQDHEGREEAFPVRIRKDAFAPGQPRRDLLVTPEHCMLTEHGLTPVRMLVNGGSIAIDRSMTRYDYFHVELEEHGIILAENLATESYLDSGNRGRFLDAALAGDHRAAAQMAAPLAVGREQVEPVWKRLAERSRSLGHVPATPAPEMLTADPHLRVLLDNGTELAATWHDAQRHMFHIPRGTRPVRLLSRSAVPADIVGPFVDDRRSLGVAVEQLVLWNAGARTILGADTLEGAGWHALEGARRWTNGSGSLELPTAEGETFLDVHVAGALSYPLD